MAKREAGRKCLIKKKAIAAKLDIDTYVEKTFGVTLSESPKGVGSFLIWIYK